MWVRRAAIRPVPLYAQVPQRALADVEERLAEDGDDARDRLDQAFARFEETQPALAERVSNALIGPLDETALALGYFLRSPSGWPSTPSSRPIEEVSETA